MAGASAANADDLTTANSEAFFYKLYDMEFNVKMATKSLLQDNENYILCLETPETSMMSVLLALTLRNLKKDEYSNPVFTDFHNFIKTDRQQNENFPDLLVCKVDMDEELDQYSQVLTSWARLVKDKSKKIIFIMKNSKYLEQNVMKTRMVNVLKIKFNELWGENRTSNKYYDEPPVNNQVSKPIHYKEETSENLLAAQTIKPIEILKLHGINLLSINEIDEKGNTPLHWAASKGQNKIVKALLDYDVPKDLRNKNGYTPLHLATAAGHHAVVNTLLENDANVNAAAKASLETALHKACMNNDIRLIKLLLKYGAGVETKSKIGRTALHFASSCGHHAAVMTLLEYGSNINAQDNHGNSSLHYAIQYNHQKVVLSLLENGADVNLENNFQKTALDQAEIFKRSILMPVIAKYEALTKKYDQ